MINRGKTSKTLNKVKQVENLKRNSQSLQLTSHLQKEVHPLRKLQDHAYE